MPWWIYAAFCIFVGTLILLDLCVLHRGEHKISTKKALGWTLFWVSIAMMFNVVVYLLYEGIILKDLITTEHTDGRTAVIQFLSAYAIEYSLSIDNIFVMAMIITAFRVPAEHQHRLLFWGIAGAAVLRGIMIFVGVQLVQRFEWTMYIFGAMLIFSALKMAFSGDDEFDPTKSRILRWTQKLIPMTPKFDGRKFFTIENGKKLATPMFLALVMIESCDVMFAIDSIPAVFSVTRDPFIVFTSNIFAILGLRSLYFALAGMMAQFHYLKMALIVLLIFVGIKMILVPLHIKIDSAISLGAIVTILTAGVVASIVFPPPKGHEAEAKDPE